MFLTCFLFVFVLLLEDFRNKFEIFRSRKRITTQQEVVDRKQSSFCEKCFRIKTKLRLFFLKICLFYLLADR